MLTNFNFFSLADFYGNVKSQKWRSAATDTSTCFFKCRSRKSLACLIETAKSHGSNISVLLRSDAARSKDVFYL